MLVPRFYYHITQKSWPKRITLLPRNNGKNRCPLEPAETRICVSTSVEGCLISLGSCLNWKSYKDPGINIYRTVSKVSAKSCYGVLDSFVTNEKWLIKPTRFMKVGIINTLIPEEIFGLSTGNLNKIPQQYKLLDQLKGQKENFITWLK